MKHVIIIKAIGAEFIFPLESQEGLKRSGTAEPQGLCPFRSARLESQEGLKHHRRRPVRPRAYERLQSQEGLKRLWTLTCTSRLPQLVLESQEGLKPTMANLATTWVRRILESQEGLKHPGPAPTTLFLTESLL